MSSSFLQQTLSDTLDNLYSHEKCRWLIKNGNVVAGEDGKPQYVDLPPQTDFGVNDLKTVWQMQRIMKGLPINYEKQDVEQVNFEADLVIKELGLQPEDFEDDKLAETTKRITEHLLSK